MKFQWARNGRVFCPQGEHPWMNSHAQVPRLIERQAELEILFATRSRPADDATFVSRIGSVRVHRQDPTRIIYVSPDPVLDVGGPGQFDEFGVMPGCVVSHGGRERLYYTGWSRPDDAPYQTFIGLAERDKDGRFLRRTKRPVLGLTPAEPILCNGPFIIE
ncbi:MAG: glucosyl hydrolase, partial [Fuerstiella sp.]|nr:glucosyl hydrolase [Fuerstiella sp.]